MNIKISDLTIGKFIFPTNFVWWTKIENHQEIKEKYLKLIDEDCRLNGEFYRKKNKWSCTVTSSFFDKYPVSFLFDDYFLKHIVWDPMDKMLKDINEILPLRSADASEVTYMWYNKYDKGDWQEIHEHCGIPPKNYHRTKKIDADRNSFSGIYLMDLTEENKTFFHDKSNIQCFTSDGSITLSTENFEEGYVILFPSELSHYVNQCVNSRTTVSFNIATSYGDLPSS
jgi:hypothetical protein